jgi:hypothetical protein
VGDLGFPLYFLLGYRASEGFRCFARVGYTQEYRRLGCTDSTLMFRAKQFVEPIGKPSRRFPAADRWLSFNPADAPSALSSSVVFLTDCYL